MVPLLWEKIGLIRFLRLVRHSIRSKPRFLFAPLLPHRLPSIWQDAERYRTGNSPNCSPYSLHFDIQTATDYAQYSAVLDGPEPSIIQPTVSIPLPHSHLLLFLFICYFTFLLLIYVNIFTYYNFMLVNKFVKFVVYYINE